MKLTYKFRAQLVEERSACAKSEDIGLHENTMILFLNEPGSRDIICWDYHPVGGGADDGVVIGIWTDNRKVTDYDGVFELPVEAVAMLRLLGLDTSEVEECDEAKVAYHVEQILEQLATKAPPRIAIKVEFEEKLTVFTEINATLKTAREYYVGKPFNFGDIEAHPRDRMLKGLSVELIGLVTP